MPMDFLRRIEDATFPLEVTDLKDIHSAAVLVAAGLIEADIPPEVDSPTRPAVVVQITPMGRVALGRMRAKLA